MKLILYILLILILFYLIYVCRRVFGESKEHFEDKYDYAVPYLLNEFNEKDDDIFDPEYVALYDIAYYDLTDIKRDTQFILSKIQDKGKPKEEIRIAVGGSGCGKVVKYWYDQGYKNIIGIDFSKHMLRRAEKQYPQLQFTRANLIDTKAFEPGSFDIFILDERVLNFNHEKDIERIFKNAFHWLKDDGYLVAPIYDKNELQLAARYYSTNYVDNMGVLHGFTYLDNFSHDCWYISDIGDGKGEEEKSEYLTLYFDKFTFKDGRKRVKTTMLYFLPKNEVYQMILSLPFRKIDIQPISQQIVGGYELAIFQKGKSTIPVKKIQEKFRVKSEES